MIGGQTMPGAGPAADGGHCQIPHGVQDRVLLEAIRRRRAEAALRACFARWGYREVIPPTFEYYDSLAVGAGPRLQQVMYRFFDQRGRTLALRSDFTPQVARLAASKLRDQPLPLRCFYVGSLFRCEEPQAGRQREFTQAGVELIGADTAAADAEVVALAISALEALRLPGFQINLGQMAFFRALAGGLDGDRLEAIRQAIDHKNQVRLDAALDGLTGAAAELMRRLPDLIGGREVLEVAGRLSTRLDEPGPALAALQRLAQVYDRLEAAGLTGRVSLDLGEVRGMDYYTGITFRGLAPGLGWPLASGGRYDDLIAQFGRPLPAVGFGLSLGRALLVQLQEGLPAIAPQLLAHTCQRPACLAVIQQLRRLGCDVESDVLGLDGDGLAALARQRGIPRTLRCAGDDWLLAAGDEERQVSASSLLQEAVSWLRGSQAPTVCGDGPLAMGFPQDRGEGSKGE